MHRAECKITLEDVPHRRGLGLVAPAARACRRRQVIAKRREPAHPHALGLRGSDLVADALAGDLALELRERQQHVERQPAHAGGGVERLGDADKADPLRSKRSTMRAKSASAAGQPIDLVDDHDIDLARGDVGEQLAAGPAAPSYPPEKPPSS